MTIEPHQLTKRVRPMAEAVCIGCGQTFTRERYRIASGEMKYCSRGCYDQSRSSADAESFWALALEDESGCWEWQGSRTIQGYGRLRMPEKRGGVIKAHRRAWELAKGPIPDGMYVLHHCDNRPCVRPDHLFLGTLTDNMQDMAAKGRAAGFQRRGAAHPLAKLTVEDVSAIRALPYHHGLYAEIARELGVSEGQISAIYRGKSWRE